MDTNWLLDFIAVVECKSISKAARLRHASSSTISRRIKALEDEVGVDLFDRTSVEFATTDAGYEFYRAALEFAPKLAAARSRIKSRYKKKPCEVSISMLPYMATSIFPKLLQHLEANSPHDYIIKANTELLIDIPENLRNYDTSFVLLIDDASCSILDSSNRLDVLELGDEVLNLYMNPFAQAENARYVGYSCRNVEKMIFDSLHLKDRLPHSFLQVDSAQAAMSIVASTNHCAYLPDSLAATGRMEVIRHPLSVPIPLKVFLVKRPDDNQVCTLLFWKCMQSFKLGGSS